MTLWILTALFLGCANGPKPAKVAKKAAQKIAKGVGDDDRGTNSSAPAGTRLMEFDTPTGKRSAYVHVPKGYDASKPAPLIFSFHGGKGSKAGAKSFVPNWKSQFDKEALLVFPNGQTDPQEEAWRSREYDDLGDVDLTLQIIDTLSDKYAIDRERVYATGFSNGGIMTSMLACHVPERFAGFAVFSQTMHKHTAEGCKTTKKAKPLLYLIGTADKHWGGRDFSMSGMESLTFWRDHLGCKSEPEKRDLPDGKGNDGTSVQRWTYTGCEQAEALEFLRVEGGGHVWPGPGLGEKKNRCTDIDGATEAVSFFERHAGL